MRRLNFQEDMESDAIVAVNIGMLLEDELREIKSVAENASMEGLIRELPASKEAGFRRRQPKDTGFEPAGSLFSCLSG